MKPEELQSDSGGGPVRQEECWRPPARAKARFL